MIRDGVADDEMIALIAPYGSGKTTLWRRVKSILAENRTVKTRFISVGDLQDKPLRMGSIISALLIELCQTVGETPMRASEARSIQLGRLLGMRREVGERVCLVIEDAHRLHPATLSALKLLREMDFNGIAPLLSIVLIGWPNSTPSFSAAATSSPAPRRSASSPRKDGWTTPSVWRTSSPSSRT